jgi:MarR-like DNA-binding transcriptional regulator SgrR of sgrS sRNA
VAGAGAFTLGFDAALPEHRAVAERLQVKLHDAGYRVRLQASDRPGLVRARTDGSLDAALVSVLLPPLPAPALAVVLALADPQLLSRELPALGAIEDPGARATRVRDRAVELQRTLPLVPLYARGLRARLGPSLVDARRDAFGLLVLDDAWLTD